MPVKRVSVRLEASKILYRVYVTESYADILLDDIIKHRSFTSQDRALLSELVFGVLRWRGQLDYILKSLYHGDWENLPVKIKIILELGLYQLLHLDRIPAFAAINEAVGITKTWATVKWSGTVNAILRNFHRDEKKIPFPDIYADPVKSIAVSWSHPEWLVQRWVSSFGIERTEAICQANNQKPDISVRVNILKANPKMVKKKLMGLGFQVNSGILFPEFLHISNGQGLFDTDLFHDGAISIQDESAGLVPKLINPQTDEIIVDMAAAPGGKTGYLTELSPKARLIAIDRHYGRLIRLRETMQRLGHPLQIIQADSRCLPIKKADKILIDAPCSGIGVLKKRAELRWRIQSDQIRSLTEIQKALLIQAVQLVKPGGIIVYSTCTTICEENQEMIYWFIKQYPQFVIEPASQWVPEKVTTSQGWIETWPDLHNMDGSFAVRMKYRSSEDE